MTIPLETRDMEWIVALIDQEIVTCEGLLLSKPDHKKATRNVKRGREIIVKLGMASLAAAQKQQQEKDNDLNTMEIDPRRN